MAGKTEQFCNAKDVEEAVQRVIQRGIASFRNEGKSFCTFFFILECLVHKLRGEFIRNLDS